MKTPIAILLLGLAVFSPSPLRASTDASTSPKAGLPPPAVGGPRDPRCHAFDEENGKTYRLLEGCPACTKMLRELDFCHGDARGVWGSVFDDVEMTSEPERPEATSNLPSMKATWSLVRRDDGKATAVSVVPLEKGQAGENWSFLDAYWFNPAHVTVQFFDYDGDGSDEVILSSFEHHFEGEPRTLIQLWTARGGAVVPYQTGVPTPLTRVEDVDHDGRPDLVTLEVSVTIPSGASARETGPDVVYHSVAGGKFDGRDAVARAAFEKSCPPELRSFGAASGRDPETLAMRLICSRAAGMTREQVTAAAERLLADAAYQPVEVKDAIDPEPSFRIPPR
jgi:hypothetical protein